VKSFEEDDPTFPEFEAQIRYCGRKHCSHSGKVTGDQSQRHSGGGQTMLLDVDRYYAKMEAMVEEIPPVYRVGAVAFETDKMRLALVEECKAWKRAFGAALNRKGGAAMDDIFAFTDNLQKILRFKHSNGYFVRIFI